jgi:hypothetical protein
LIEIHYVDFKKPRQTIIELIGDDNQNCPVSIIYSKHDGDIDLGYFNERGTNFLLIL